MSDGPAGPLFVHPIELKGIAEALELEPLITHGMSAHEARELGEDVPENVPPWATFELEGELRDDDVRVEGTAVIVTVRGRWVWSQVTVEYTIELPSLAERVDAADMNPTTAIGRALDRMAPFDRHPEETDADFRRRLLAEIDKPNGAP